MKKIKRLLSFIAIISLLVSSQAVLVSCQKEANNGDYLIAYTNSTNDDVEYYSYSIPDKDSLSNTEIANILITQLLVEGREDGIHYSPLPAEVKLLSAEIEDKTLTLNFDEGYNNLTNVQELMLKACVVLTLDQVDDVRSIVFTINGQPITDHEGKEIGAMDPSQYVDILLSDEELLRQETTLKIYFANEDGTGLVASNYTFTLDNQTQSLEEYMVRKLIEGPGENAGYPTLDPQLELISVTTTDMTCYVNFGANFLEQNKTASDDIMIYSIVNSLTGLAYISNVQFLVNGDSDIMLHKTIDLSKPFTRNFDLIQDNSTGS